MYLPIGTRLGGQETVKKGEIPKTVYLFQHIIKKIGRIAFLKNKICIVQSNWKLKITKRFTNPDELKKLGYFDLKISEEVVCFERKSTSQS